MNPATIIATLILVVLYLAIRHLVKAHRQGVKGVGCPLGEMCTDMAQTNAAYSSPGSVELPLRVKHSGAAQTSRSCGCGH